ncbi:cytochrome b5 reductase 4 isoform X2 [Uranotaenia lowii]|uniref:cytochrome b5 reductase 4 isoform X2 n=1 Tax=Uranotaenia lowii TaxID=190385 RepID=UPI002479F99A|nr:cytochrome b5 reductase 4 isoform X2 [Uranotaenia lowii]XP_055597356.1 cytochrome b5 reductase 4 isoform X2 [Uranotaenia lowii]XP_055597358.1 cytochrome b5 reductase 4 isoform X2 [Uranotaenia lowii]
MMDNKTNLQVPAAEKSVKNASTSPIKVPSAQLKTPAKQPQTASATGNPRNKTALKPGHSLMDWIRLGNSGVDLTGVGGKVRPVSHAELAQHNKPGDTWMAIRGKVYNVSGYLDFHPGGADELMRGAGKDATKLFDEVHAWVNYESLLAKCFVGPLRNTATLNLSASNSSGSMPPPTSTFLKPPSPATPPGGSAKPVVGESSGTPKVMSASSVVSSSSEESTSRIIPIVPRFDWIQKTAEVTFIFYTRALCNPAIVIEFINNLEFIVRFFLEGNVLHRYKFQVANNVQWPCTVRQSLEAGKVEIVFNKLLPGLWTIFGQMEHERKENYEMELNEYDVATRIEITHDSCALLLRPKNNSILQVTPIGHHLTVTGNVGGEFLTRSYTPVPGNAIPTECPATFVPLLVKAYPTGGLSQHISKPVPLATSLQLSQPSGNFSLAKIKYHNRIALLAAGSGLTPMLALLNYLLDRSSNKMESISLVYFNKTEADIWCRELLDNLCEKDARLTVRHYLSDTEPPSPRNVVVILPGKDQTELPTTTNPTKRDEEEEQSNQEAAKKTTTSSSSSNVTSTAEPTKPVPKSVAVAPLERGRISLDIARQLTNVDSPLHATYVCLCGPKPFNELSCQYLEQAGHNMGHVHSFQG